MDTIIYLSNKDLHKEQNKILSILKNKNFNMFQYESIWHGVVENGFQIIFFEELEKKDLTLILAMFREQLKIKCFYIKNSRFEGCIDEYLLGVGKGCIIGKWL